MLRRTTPARFPYWAKVAIIGISLNALICTQAAQAASISWNGGAGSFSNSGNWSGGVPGAGDDAVISSGGTDNVTFDPATVSLNSLGVGPNATASVLAGNQLTVGTGNSGLVLDNAGTLSLNAGGLVGGRVTVDQASGGAATNTGLISLANLAELTIANGGGATQFTNFGTVAATGAGSRLYLDGAGGTFTFSGSGTLALAGGLVSGVTSTEALVNDYGHTISGFGQIGNAAVTNLGSLRASGGDLVLDHLTGFDAGIGFLDGGIYETSAGANLRLNNIGAGEGIHFTNAVLVLGGNGQIQNAAGGDAVSGTLEYVSGGLILQAGANVSLTAASFLNNNLVSVSSSTLNLTGTSLVNEFAGTLNSGTWEVRNGGSILYSGTDINTIGFGTTVSFGADSNNITNTATGHTITSTLTTNQGTLELAPGASVALTAASFENQGQVNLGSGATLNLTGTSFLNESAGHLTGFGASFALGNGSQLSYSGNDIAAIDNGVSLSLAGSAQISNVAGSSNALTGLALNAGNLELTGGASLSLSQPTFTNTGSLALHIGSVLNVANLNNGDGLTFSSGSVELTGGSVLGVSGAVLQNDGGSQSQIVARDTSSVAIIGQFAQTGVGSTISAFDKAQISAAGLTNDGGLVKAIGDGSLSAAMLDFRGGAFTNLDGSTGTLSNGRYEARNGSILYSSSGGTYGGEILHLNNASVTLEGSGRMAYGPGATDPFTGLRSLEDSKFEMIGSGQTRVMLNSSNQLTLDNVNLNNTALRVSGGASLTLGTVADTMHLVNNDADVAVDGSGSSLAAFGNYTQSNGGFLTPRLAVTNGAQASFTGSVTLNTGFADVGGNSVLTANGFTNLGQISVNDGGTADFRGGAFTNLDGSTGTLSYGTYEVAGTLYYEPSAGTHGGEILHLNQADIVLSGSGQMLYGGGGTDPFGSLTSIDGGSLTLSFSSSRTITPVGGTLAVQAQGKEAFISLINSGLTVAGNLSLAGAGGDQASLTVDQSYLQVNGNFAQNGTQFRATTLLDTGNMNVDGAVSQTVNTRLTVQNSSSLTAHGLNNLGTLRVMDDSEANFRSGVAGGWQNLAAGTHILSGTAGANASYVLAGTMYYDNTTDGGGQILGLRNVDMQIIGDGGLFFEAGDAGNVDGLQQINRVENGSLSFSGANRYILPEGGTFTLHGDNDAASLNLRAGSQITLDGAVDVQTSGTGTAEVLLTQGSSLTVTGDYTMYGGKTIVNAGTTLTAPNVILQGGTLSGFGTINGNVVNVAGTIAPGDPGQTTINGNLTQQAAGLMVLEFAGTSQTSGFDNLIINGDVNLNGTLRIDLINGFVPTSAMSFRILQWTGILTGNFAAMIFPVFGNLTFTQVINANDITLLVSDAPEPATFGLGFALLAAGLWIRRQRRQS